jgi:hypothetical protein
MLKFFRHNSLSLVFILLFMLALAGQFFTGFAEYNIIRKEKKDGHPSVSYANYFSSGHFIQATFENWESEFLQMALFVVLTIWLRQKGSSESKKCDGPEEVDREPDPRRKGDCQQKRWATTWPIPGSGLNPFKTGKASSCLFLLLWYFLFSCGRRIASIQTGGCPQRGNRRMILYI